MTYSLSFSPEFFYASGEPYDTSNYTVDANGHPTSLYSAIMMRLETDDKFVEEVDELLEVSDVPFDVLALELMNRAKLADTCSNITVPVEVWLEETGNLTVEVW